MNILLNYEKNGSSHKLKSYLQRNGYTTADKVARRYRPEEVLEEVKKVVSEAEAEQDSRPV